MVLDKLTPKVVAKTLIALGVMYPTVAYADYYREAPGGWAVAVADSDTCGTINKFEFQNITTTLFLSKDIDGDTYISVSNPNWTIVKDRSYDIRYTLNGNTYGGASTALSGGFAIKIDSDFVQDFAAAGSLFMSIDGKVIDHLSLKGSGLALKYLNECVSILKRTYDAEQRQKAEFSYIDANPFSDAKPMPRPPGQNPEPLSSNWVTLSDYPSLALLREHQGASKFKAKIGIDGKVVSCEIISSSGHAELDEATCKNVTRRGRFNPATDAEGMPVEGYFEGSVEWKLPR